MFSTWQELLGLLEGYGLDTPTGSSNWQLQDLSSITSGDIVSAMNTMFDFDTNPETQGETPTLTSQMFTPIRAEQLDAAMGKTYSPLLESATSQGLTKMKQTLDSKQATQASGGFAGSGQFTGFQKGAKDVYGKGLEQTLSNISQSKGQAMGSLRDIMQGWKETASSLAG
tara:strand:- start:371 stop:880 length:510 start_codon:yes stop_codon:yes gene_type:complete